MTGGRYEVAEVDSLTGRLTLVGYAETRIAARRMAVEHIPAPGWTTMRIRWVGEGFLPSESFDPHQGHRQIVRHG